jgi:hypothetical protein
MICVLLWVVCTWAQDERPADLHMAQPNVPVSKTGQFPPAKIVCGGRAMQGDHTLATICFGLYVDLVCHLGDLV